MNEPSTPSTPPVPPPVDDVGQEPIVDAAATLSGDVGGPNEPAVLAEPDPATPNVPAKPADIATISGLLRYAYDQAGKRFVVPLAVLELLSNRTDVTEDVRSLVRQLAASDHLVAVPPRLMVATEQPSANGSLKLRIAELMTLALASNPIFQNESIASVLTGTSTDVDGAMDALSRRIRLKAELKDSERERLQQNAVVALTMVLSTRERWTLDRVIDSLDASLWQPERRSHKGGTPKSLLFDSRTPETLGVLTDAYAKRLRAAGSDVREAERYASWSKDRANQAADELDRALAALAASEETAHKLQERVLQLEDHAESARRDRAADHSHYAADYEALRTRILRMLTQERDLLEDGLHAARNGRTHIAEEFMERVIDKLRAEADQLGGKGRQ